MKKEHKNAMTRRGFIKGAGLVSAAAALGGCGAGEGLISKDDIETYLQSHFTEMSPEEKQRVKERLQRKYKEEYGKDFVVGMEPDFPDVLFGYALDLSRCIGCRRCVDACVQENNQSRSPQKQWIRVLRFENGNLNFEESEHYYEASMVPTEGHYTMPTQCQQCENPPCVKVCPTTATWKEPNGIVVVDYDWCIGCRYCMAACPYWARRFNFATPEVPEEELNTNVHYLGNRPRQRGVVEKCTFCVQRTRKGRYPACVEVCPVGARKFGNLLDPDGEMGQVLEHQRVFRLKEELNTQPKFYYFFSV